MQMTTTAFSKQKLLVSGYNLHFSIYCSHAKNFKEYV